MGLLWVVRRAASRRGWRQCSYVTGNSEVTLANELAFLVDEEEKKKKKKLENERVSRVPLSRIQTARLLELRVKKSVKAQLQEDGKFHCLMHHVVANPNTLKHAYNRILLQSNILHKTNQEKEEEEEEEDHICFTSLSEEVASGAFDVKANTAPVSTTPGALVLPLLKLRVVEEAVRMALEVVFRPHFSKFSHGGRSNRGHYSALRYIRKEVKEPDWWFTVPLNKKADHLVLTNLISFISQHVHDPLLFHFIQSLFDARVLNLEFGGGFPKGQGLPQEGALSPLFINLYLAPFDHQFFRFSLRFEALGPSSGSLRAWFRRQLKPPSIAAAAAAASSSSSEKQRVKLYYCRHLDEMFFAVSGSAEVAQGLKSETERYLMEVLRLEMEGGGIQLVPCREGTGVGFLGTVIRKRGRGGVRVVHKLRDKVELFASQKLDAWTALTFRIGKKWLAHGVRKTKEDGGLEAIRKHNPEEGEGKESSSSSSSSLLTRVSFCFRKPGMRNLHWYKHLIKIWLMEKKKKKEWIADGVYSENVILRKHICEPSLPQELMHSLYEFQKQVTAYLNSEAESLSRLTPGGRGEEGGGGMTEVVAPIEEMRRGLRGYGLGRGRHAQGCYTLSVQGREEILRWFEGMGRRWMRWYGKCDNVGEVVGLVGENVRRSCILTLGAKFQMSEVEAENKFQMELTRIPTKEEVEEGGGGVRGEEEDMWWGGGPWLLSVARLVRRGRREVGCTVVGCGATAPCVYKLRSGPGVHCSLTRIGFGLCREHVKDLYMGRIPLSSLHFGCV